MLICLIRLTNSHRPPTQWFHGNQSDNTSFIAQRNAGRATPIGTTHNAHKNGLFSIQFIEKPSLNEHTYLQVIVYIITVLVYVFVIVYCFMHAYDRSLVNITLTVSCLVSINSSLDALIESEYYMLIPATY